MNQPTPTPNSEPGIQDELIEYIRLRKQIGIANYGTVLQVGNGRDMIDDALDESLDLTIYLMGVKRMRARIISTLRHVRDMHSAYEGDENLCRVCDGPGAHGSFPCHTRTDVEYVLKLLGALDG